ncbi:TAT-variant-translocated molybdopterin oxidoreductase [Mucilaginibacter sp. BJC16-A38]|uniref:TAT-variant-translocated molybdopterin oxidoreductase n=1 Tax=Mucilaginibacter phenanthrenivorans TaxID=1234842 RepID=UPI002157DD18|nr:TAT-variant-translocated molybdopterin oxidoreductase [Mucilaginibacter phenanthrenivorans]MCR8558724.1 TAT-variant-translocated molybdopterin oxidoreductase [Mucilaginibacter phenanthrenivorans]
MDSNKKYWKGLEELNKTPEFVELNKHEFAEPIPIEEVLTGGGLEGRTPRRDFLKALGFGVGAVTLAACQKVPVHKSLPYLIKPEEVTPGVPNYYVSTYDGQAILVKTREGRPIKIEGHPNDILAKGGASAQAQASVLDLYDTNRFQSPTKNGAETGWAQVDDFVVRELLAIKAGGKKIRIVSSTVSSPSTLGVIADFIKQFPTAAHINYDAVSYNGIIKGNQNSFGKAVLPHYNFDKADIIVSFAADFLGTWISPEEFTRQYVSNRNIKSLESKKMSRHIQFETGMSLTGSNADVRIPIKPSEEGPALVALYNAISGSTLPGTKTIDNKVAANAITIAAKELVAAKGKALVVAGSNDVATQVLVNAINSLLGSYGTTIDLDNPSLQYAGNDAEFVEFVSDMKSGAVDAVFFLNANPAYDYYNSKDIADGLKKVRLKVSFASNADETSSLCNIVAPNHHYLESWGDDNAISGYYTVLQPTINPVYDTRQAEQSLMKWSDNPLKDYYSYVRNNWNTSLLAKGGLSGQSGWETLLQTGFVKAAPVTGGSYTFAKDLNAVAQTILDHSKELAGDKTEVQLYQSVAMRDGKRANNPWLQELPDPVSKVTWDNFAAMAPSDMKRKGLVDGDVVKIDANGYSVALPVLSQPGQAQGTISVAVGYGRTVVGPVGKGVGQNAFPFYSLRNGTFQTSATATLTPTGDNSPLAQTQTHHSIEGRNSIIKEATFVEYKKNPAVGTGKSEDHKDYTEKNNLFWQKYERPTYDWVMAIDLNACTGCGACVVACSAENNVPVVGKDEVKRRREMHWIRIDRYYSFDDKGDGGVTREHAIADLNTDQLDHVKVVYQPMLCQHCDHAPCETVCPVLATVHSSEGLNHMAYNRCVGTRYCANNCPYKVRRFNWFNYWNDARFENYLQNDHTLLVLNPDVTTRFRGVMEKCSMCIQRIQAGKLKAKIEKRPLKDGEIKMACQQTCSANAIVFGNRNDPDSEVSKALASERTYYVLEELGVQPGVGYQTKIRNISELEA